MDINFTSTVLTNQAAAAVMGPTGGRIINFGSSEGVMGSPMSAIYAASKAAVAIVDAVGGQVLGVPGHHRQRAGARGGNPRRAATSRLPRARPRMPIIEQQLQMSIPLGGKLGDPVSDVGPMLVFLAGDGSQFITGQLLAVDGGLMMLG